ncbi:uncharacterized protein LOC118647960 [Monomorium pharaonis]|uniref:uncharacterized protein LOC118647960 n=1 Tax=Monomorium pharaonis TaxID=307658 RepID=UPI0017466B6C|nr:uncharacterized protein LOC118647960 [Monomorium pharaonis]
MASESEQTNAPEKEITDIQDLSDEKQNEKNIDIEMTSKNPKKSDGKSMSPKPKDKKSTILTDKQSTTTESKREEKKRPKFCDEEPYIVKLFKSLIKENQKSAEEKTK